MKKGSAELLILSLVETRARHGYEIGELIEQKSAGAIVFSAAALYPLRRRRAVR
ncbi:MAG: helix-turn-helix transcriptional regulator [Acidobacteria bacterium]|nr:helix-turn-helix transcriptional regulator [Acidobacteriota bacterium]